MEPIGRWACLAMWAREESGQAAEGSRLGGGKDEGVRVMDWGRVGRWRDGAGGVVDGRGWEGGRNWMEQCQMETQRW